MPYTVIQVLLDNGVRLYSNLVDGGAHSARIGARVEAVFEAVTPAVTLVRFRQADDAWAGGATAASTAKSE